VVAAGAGEITGVRCAFPGKGARPKWGQTRISPEKRWEKCVSDPRAYPTPTTTAAPLRTTAARRAARAR
jgi:hypothetical protein